MALDFSQIEQQLARESQVSQPRQILIFAGEKQWQLDSLNKLIETYADDSLWVGNETPEGVSACSVTKAHHWLGGEKKLVVFDANDFKAELGAPYFDADAFAAISGIIFGGGFLMLLMPDHKKWQHQYATLFGQRLINSINTHPEIVIVTEMDSEIQLNTYDVDLVNKNNNRSSEVPPNLEPVPVPFLTFDQLHAVEEMQKYAFSENHEPVVLVSDRGRGKSAALGITAAKLISSGLNKIIITAPRLRASEIVFKHAAENLPNTDITRGKIRYKNSEISFYPPDLLLQENLAADVLFIDEAAAIPVPLLSALLKKYPQVFFSTTVHGYEGTGRGFALRFNKILDKEKPGWKKLKMTTPIRWMRNDPLEEWVFKLLCLDAELVKSEKISNFEKDKLEIKIVNKMELAENEVLLKEVFSLLVLAHYKTQPSDLQRLLDNQDISLYIALFNQHVIGVTLVNHEGLFSPELSELVYQGVRRAKGHLLAQTLTYHCGIQQAATLNYARIMRIAVHPELQQRGIGSALLDFIVSNEKATGNDAIGSSFGLNNRLLSFWQKNHFSVVRIGFTREQTSGEHAAIMLMPFSSEAKVVYEHALERFSQQLPFLIEDVLKDISELLNESFAVNKSLSTEINEFDKNDLHSFIKTSRNYELCISAINKLVLLEQQAINDKSFPENFREVINEKIFKNNSWKLISSNMKLNGKNFSRQLFYDAILYLLENYRNEILKD